MKSGKIRGIHYHTGLGIEISFEKGLISSVIPLLEADPYLPVIAPGLVDLQVNGFGGIDFNQGPITLAELQTVAHLLYEKGVSCFFPTLITQDHKTLIAASKALAENIRQLNPSPIGGIHLEGPFISPEDGARGAHPRAYVCPPDRVLFSQIQEAAGGMINMLTLSPEWPDSPAFITWCVNQGVKVAIGHTSASPAQIQDAVAAGATFSTHLGNGAHLMLPRHPNYLWEQLASDELAAGMIADGFHLPDSFMRVLMRVKKDNLFLVSDSTALAGMPAGTYEAPIGGKVVLDKSGRLCLQENPKILAGSAVSLLDCVNYLQHAALCSWQQAWEMASVNPARLMQLYPFQGIIEGAPANLLELKLEKKAKLRVEKTYLGGEVVFTGNS